MSDTKFTPEFIAQQRRECRSQRAQWSNVTTTHYEGALDEIERLRDTLLRLMTAAEMHRAWEVHSSDDFNEMYPDEEGWAHGDVDENLVQAMEQASSALNGK